MNQPRRCVLIGAGAHALSAHGPYLQQSTEVDLVGIVEPSAQSRAQFLLDFPDLKIGDDPADVCRKTNADIALVCTPPKEAEFSIAALLDYCPAIFVEKPAGVYSQEVERLAALATAQGVQAVTGYHYRFHPQVQALTNAYRKFRSGPGRKLKLHFSGAPALPHTWRADPLIGGGALRDLGVHLLDLARQIAGPLTLQNAHFASNVTPADEVRMEYLAGDGSEVYIHARYHSEPRFSLEASQGGNTFLETLWGRGLVTALLRRMRHGSIDQAREAALATWWQHALANDGLAPTLYEAADILRMVEEIEAHALPS